MPVTRSQLSTKLTLPAFKPNKKLDSFRKRANGLQKPQASLTPSNNTDSKIVYCLTVIKEDFERAVDKEIDKITTFIKGRSFDVYTDNLVSAFRGFDPPCEPYNKHDLPFLTNAATRNILSAQIQPIATYLDEKKAEFLDNIRSRKNTISNYSDVLNTIEEFDIISCFNTKFYDGIYLGFKKLLTDKVHSHLEARCR